MFTYFEQHVIDRNIIYVAYNTQLHLDKSVFINTFLVMFKAEKA